MIRKKRILWADDEIEMLKPHILFLQEKGYEIVSVISGQDALDCFRDVVFDIVFLDENMPGLTGIETLSRLKEINPAIPVIMITKSEDEGIMTQAIGRKIADYLIKPVNPNQILSSIKKNLHKDDIVSEMTVDSYRDEYMSISELINNALNVREWNAIYRKLVYWDLELTAAQSPLIELLHTQKLDADKAFSRFIRVNYESWMSGNDAGKPLTSPDIFRDRVFPLLDNNEKVFFVLIDNFRLDQWCYIKDLFTSDFIVSEDTYYSILPTATQYARNAIFAGMMPAQIAKLYPDMWIEESVDESKNSNEQKLLENLLSRTERQVSFSYNKILTSVSGEKLVNNMDSLSGKQLNIVVLNFVDMLSHARTNSAMIRELASDEAAYRSLTRSWFMHSPTLDMLKKAVNMGYKIVLTTDHGTIRVKNPQKVVSDKTINDSARYKTGKNIGYDRKKVYDILNPQKVGLPTPNLSTKYIFACGEDYFVYPNNYNQFVSLYTDSFQHGGISMEEMIVPLITITSK